MKCKTQNKGPLRFSLLWLTEQRGWWWESRERAVQDPCSVALRYWRLWCTPWHCSLQKFYSLSLIHMAPREAAPLVQRPYPRLHLTGPRVSMQPNQGQHIVSLRIWIWHQARWVALSLCAMFTEEDKSTEGKKRLRRTQWERPGWEQQVLRSECRCIPKIQLSS